MRNTILTIFIGITILFGVLVYFTPETGNIILLSISGFLSLIAIHDSLQTKHSLLRAFPVFLVCVGFLKMKEKKLDSILLKTI